MPRDEDMSNIFLDNLKKKLNDLESRVQDFEEEEFLERRYQLQHLILAEEIKNLQFEIYDREAPNFDFYGTQKKLDKKKLKLKTMELENLDREIDRLGAIDEISMEGNSSKTKTFQELLSRKRAIERDIFYLERTVREQGLYE